MTENLKNIINRIDADTDALRNLKEVDVVEVFKRVQETTQLAHKILSQEEITELTAIILERQAKAIRDRMTKQKEEKVSPTFPANSRPHLN